MNGYFKIHRSLFTSAVWVSSSNLQKVVLITLLGMAVWKETEVVLKTGTKLRLKPGQFVATLKEVENTCNGDGDNSITRKVVMRAIDRFKNLGFLDIDRASAANNDGYVVTIVNWRLYQVDEADEGQQQGQRQGQRRDNEMPEQGQPTNIKENKEEYKENIYNTIPPYNPPVETAKPKRKAKAKPEKTAYAEFVRMTPAEYDKLVVLTGGEQGAQWCIERLDNYKGSTGKTYRDDFRAIKAWVIGEFEKHKNEIKRKAGRQYGADRQACRTGGDSKAEKPKLGDFL